MDYDEIMDSLYNIKDKFNWMIINEEFLDINEIEDLLQKLKRINREFMTTISDDLRKENKGLFDERIDRSSINTTELLSAVKQNNKEYGLQLVSYFNNLSNALIKDYVNFKEFFVSNQGFETKNKSNNSLVCENCGGKIENEAMTSFCPYCGEKIYDEMENIRKEEIDRLINPNIGYNSHIDTNTFFNGWVKEPIEGILTDTEILKYAPKSKAAAKIRIEKGEANTSDKIMNNGYLFFIWFGGLLIGFYIAIFAGMGANSAIVGILVFAVIIIICSLITYHVIKK